MSFKNTVIIMTSNIGSQFILNSLDEAGGNKEEAYEVRVPLVAFAVIARHGTYCNMLQKPADGASSAVIPAGGPDAETLDLQQRSL